MGFFNSVGDIVEVLGTAIANAFNSIATIFWTPGVGDAAGAPTLIGYLGLGALGLSILGFAFKFVATLVKQKMSK